MLTIPDVADKDTLSAALAYASAGWYVGPLVNGSKNPGSRLGKTWQTQTSRDQEVIMAWFAGSDDGLFLHVGRSGAVVFDVDTPDRLDGVLLAAIGVTRPPYQSTRSGVPGRGHYVFAQPAGRLLGNGLGKLPGGWGEIRGANGVIVAAPTRHEKAELGGEYRWATTGPVPTLPDAVADLLHDSTPGLDAADDATVRAFLDEHTAGVRPAVLDVWCGLFEAHVADGASRHDTAVRALTGALKEARAGYFPARAAMDRLEKLFLHAVTTDGHGQQGKARTAGVAVSEWLGVSAWAVAQANAADLDEVHARVAEQMGADGDDLSWIDGGGDGSGEGDGGSRGPAVNPDTGEIVSSPSMFFDPHTGLRALNLSKAVLSSGALAGDHGGALYRYADGVWLPDGERETRARVAERLADRYRIAHASTVVDMLRNRPPLFTDDNADTAYLNLPNGLLDWTTGKLHPHDPSVPSMIRIPVDWQPDATCPEIEAWMREVFPADAIPFLYEVVGYCLLNDNPLHKAILLFGRGRNGKGTFLRLLKALIGADNISSVTPQSLDDNRYRAAELHGKLANLVGDVDPRIFKATETFKQVTGGDTVTAERKYGQPFRFTCRATMVAAFNSLPRSSDTSEGFFSRWLVVPFVGYFPAGVADPNREARLHEPGELRGLLNAATRGLARLMIRSRFDLPPSVEQATNEFRAAADTVRAFLAEHLEMVDVEEWRPRTTLYNAYAGWASDNGHSSMSAASFYERALAASLDAAASHTLTERTRQGTRGLLITPKRQGAAGAGVREESYA